MRASRAVLLAASALAAAAAILAAPNAARAQVSRSPWVADSSGVPVPVVQDTTRAARDTVVTPAAPAGPSLREHKVKPFFVMARSALVPGWGQMYNRQPLKAVVAVAGEGFLTYKIFQELHRQNDAIDRANHSIIDSPEQKAADDDALTHKNKKIDWIWWTAAAHLLQMADAYVDAHFLNFDAEFGPDDKKTDSGTAPPLPRDTRVSLALRVNF